MDIKEKNLRKLSYGLYLIGAMDGERPCGCIVNTVFQVTSENPIIATSINKNNYTWELVQKNGRFSVSILSEKTRKEVIQKLGFVSGKDHDKYEGIDYRMQDGLPILNEKCCGALICKVVSVTETPTHMVVLASVEDAFDIADTVPMTYRYYHEVIRGGAPKNAPSYIAPEKEETSNKQTSAQRWVCDVCGYVYEGDLTQEPDDYTCPLCGVNKTHFIKETKEETKMAETERWVCDVCGYVYEGDLTQEPDDYVCPLCGVDKSHFTQRVITVIRSTGFAIDFQGGLWYNFPYHLGVAQLVACYLGVVEAVGSSPATQTKKQFVVFYGLLFLFVFRRESYCLDNWG